jgi:CelD/BcsL family acetyltransferase involved in cellulose biosynthesis
MRISTSAFIFELFQKNRIHPFYKTQIINKLSGKKLNISHSENIITETNNTHMISDIPDYLEVKISGAINSNKVKKIRQYKGYLINLRDYKDTNDYLLNQLSRKTRKNIFSKLRKLENAHKITFECYYGEIAKDHYDLIFDLFYELSARRFAEKKMYNKNLIKWKYYYEMVYPLILEKKAFLFVIYDQDNPIDISLNFHLGDMGFGFIHTYDINYSNYGMGDIAMLKRLEWCFEYQVPLFDLLMGETEHKLRWCNHTYDFKYHIFYNPKSLASILSTQIIYLKLKLKQFLRDKNIIGKLFQYDKFFYKRRIKKLKNYNWKEV